MSLTLSMAYCWQSKERGMWVHVCLKRGVWSHFLSELLERFKFFNHDITLKKEAFTWCYSMALLKVYFQ